MKPVDLMRSRYSAYALKLADYIIATTDPESPHYEKDLTKWKKSILEFGNLDFTGLEILEEKDDTVTFKAHLRQENKDLSFIEKSLFRRKEGLWLYMRAQ
ncbi:MAG: YchJ family metal-binding protein [Parachlamydiaceae bacterium]